MRGDLHIVSLRMDCRLAFFIAALMVLCLTQSNSAPYNSGHHLWEPSDGVNRTTWLQCHGLNCSTWSRVKAKMRQIAAIQVAAGLVPASAAPADPNRNWLPPDVALDSDLDALDGCIKLTEDQADEMIRNFNHYLYNRGKKRRKRKVLDFTRLSFRQWTSFPIKYKFDGRHRERELTLIRSAIAHWEAQTCIRFQEVDMDQNLGRESHILFTREGTGCHSFIGKVPIIPQQLNLQYTCLWEFGIPVHEIGHALGFWHEHQRWDRDAAIRVFFDNVGYYTSQYYKQPTESLGVPYDIGSVMHYGPRDGSVNGQNVMETRDPLYQSTMGQKTGLSFLDTKLMNIAYCKSVCLSRPLARPCDRGGYQNPNDCSRCKCPDGFGGTYCDTVAPPQNAQCGGLLTANGAQQVITSPGYEAGPYQDFQECSWLITAPPRHQIVLKFVERFGMFCYKQDQCHHWVEVKYKSDFGLPGPRFCCYDKPTAVLTSTNNEMMVVMRANWTTFWDTFRTGFKATYIAIREDGQPVPVPPNIPTPPPTPAPTQAPTPAPTPPPTPPPTPAPTPAPPRLPPTPYPTPYPTPPPTPYPTPPPTPYPTPPPTPYPTPPPTPYPTPAPTPYPTFAPPVPSPVPPVNPSAPTRAPPDEVSDCRKMDIAFLLDSSGSIGVQNWQLMLNFVKEVAQRFRLSPNDVRVGVITFGNEATMDIRFNDYPDITSFIRGIDRIPWKDQWTNTSGALYVMRTFLFNQAAGDRPDVPNFGILITDGEANRDSHLTMVEADMAIRQGIRTMVIGIGDKINVLEATGIALGSQRAQSITSGVDSNVIQVSNFREFIDVNTVAKVTKFICPTYGTESDPRQPGNTPAPPWTWYCGFENQAAPWCGISQDPSDQFDFTRWSGGTPSELTGPEAANTGRYYIYIEASNPRQEGDRAILRLPYLGRQGAHCVRFFYHMFGYHIRTLEAFLQRASGVTFLWRQSSQQGREWRSEAFTVDLQPSDVIGFSGIRGEEYSGDIAIDDISVTSGRC